MLLKRIVPFAIPLKFTNFMTLAVALLILGTGDCSQNSQPIEPAPSPTTTANENSPANNQVARQQKVSADSA